MSGSGDQNRPREPRIVVNKEFASVEEFIREYIVNVSRTGCFIRTDEKLEVGTEVAVKLSVIVEDIETIEGIGTVVRVSDDPPGMGIEFKELTQISRALIERLMARRLARKGKF